MVCLAQIQDQAVVNHAEKARHYALVVKSILYFISVERS